jgi:cytidylate kinase
MSFQSLSNRSIAIDGPAGAGKSTVARRIAAEIGSVYIDSGAMYRAVAWKCAEKGIAVREVDKISEIARSISIEFIPSGSLDEAQRVIADGIDITSEIRSETISQAASAVSAISDVRKSLVAKQQQLASSGGVVMEGRDIGSVVLPNADVKIFLTASIEERARRRYEQLRQKGVADVSYDAVLADIAQRDLRDTTRAASPLVKAEGAIEIDSDRIDIDGVVAQIVEIGRRQTENTK